MPAFTANGARLTKTTLTTTNPPAATDPVVVVGVDVYEGYNLPGAKDLNTGRRLKWRAGKRVRQSEVDALFTVGTITTVAPNTGPAAGNTAVTITGTGLDGATAVRFGATSATQVVVAPNGKTITCRTPAGAAGAVNVVVVDDSGNVTATNAFTYTA